MKLFFLSCLFTAAVAGSANYPPRFAYLVVPPGSQQNATAENSTATAAENSTTTAAPTTFHDDKENLEAVNEKVMERFGQEIGSNSGVYHIYLPDGRLQKVQYTSAPVGEQKAEQAQAPKSEKQQTSTSGQYLSGEQGVYYVQVPEERFQQLRTFQYPSNPVNNQATQNGAFARYEENPAAQVNAQFVPLRFVTAEQMTRIRSSADYAAEQEANKEDASAPDEQFVRQQFATSERFNKQAQEVQPGYVASVRYTDVQPIAGPVFSYSPQDLVRILRHANH